MHKDYLYKINFLRIKLKIFINLNFQSNLIINLQFNFMIVPIIKILIINVLRTTIKYFNFITKFINYQFGYFKLIHYFNYY